MADGVVRERRRRGWGTRVRQATGRVLVAIDLGASSGRVLAGRVEGGLASMEEVSRFGNGVVEVAGHLHWDILALWREILDALRLVGRQGGLASIGVDGWAVDYGLLDVDGELLGNPFHYRDRRTEGFVERAWGLVGRDELYRRNGIAPLPLVTAFQLMAAAGTSQHQVARTVLLVPDLVNYWLTGEMGAELTNASTTGLLAVSAPHWDTELIERLGLRPAMFPRLRGPGERVGMLTPAVQVSTGLTGLVPVTAVASHDTASAVVAVPAVDDRFAYISSGTWSLVGVELTEAVLSEAALEAGFTNERGVDGTFRFLRNVMGHWLLQESVRTWQAAGQTVDLAALLAAAARIPSLKSVVDVDDPSLSTPGDMPARLARLCGYGGQQEPGSPAEVLRCILDSMAIGHRRALRQAQELSGKEVTVVHMVGGGARNELLCQLTADACGLPVLAGPAEASALGNLLVQARSVGQAVGDLAALRSISASSSIVRRYEPRPGETWHSAERRIAGTL
ncbi:MAG: rhamnulokinase [Acidimicrobiales bacterium]